MLIRGRTGLGFLTEAAIEEYVRCYTLTSQPQDPSGRS
jgi:hypothetical protein